MVVLDYLFDPEELKKLKEFKFEKLTGTDLDFYLFCGSIIFRVNGVSFDASWKWIPLFDFCVRINEVLAKLQSYEHAILEFTENEATIVFHRDDSFVSIHADYANANACVPFGQLLEAVNKFSKRLIRELIDRWPVLMKTTPFQERLQIIGSSSGECFTD